MTPARARAARAPAHRAASASVAAETRYVSDLRRLLRGIHEGTMRALAPAIAASSPRTDAKVRTPDQVITKVIAGLPVHVAKYVSGSFDKMSKEVNKKNLAGMKVLGITPKDIGAKKLLAAARDANIKLVENAGREYADSVREIFGDPENFGARVEDLQQKLEELCEARGQNLQSRGELIARDQTLKTNAALTQSRHEAAGITKYTWSTSQDERVRDMHAELEGSEQSWDAPPVTNPQGDENHPGEDYQCRCVAIPVIDTGEEDTE